MKDIVMKRAKELGTYIKESGDTVRGTAKRYGISKSTVHKDVSCRLREIEPILYEDVRKVLDKNKEERHIRGGIATKNKYLKARLEQKK